MDKEINTASRLDALRRVAFQPFSWVTSGILTALGLLSLLDQGPPGGLIYIGIAIFAAVNIIGFEIKKQHLASSVVLILLIATASLYMYYSNQAEALGSFWLIIFPIPTVLLVGRTLGAVFVTAYTLAFVPGLLLPTTLNVGYSMRYTFFVMLATNVVTLLIFVYERIISHYITTSLLHTERLQTAADHLKEEIMQREQVDYKMRIVLEDLANKNQKLEELTRIDEATISSIGEAVLMVNQEGVITRANPSSGRVLGINQEELIKRRLEKLIMFEDLEGNKIKHNDFIITQSIKHRSIIEQTYKGIRPDKSEFYAHLSASPLVVSGTVFGAVVVIRDVTQEVNVDQAKTEFVSIASHQLRTPLSTINWYLEMVLGGDFGEVNDEQREFIQEAYDAGQRMGHLIDSLLNVSRIDVGVFAIDPHPLDMNKAIEEVLNDLNSRITEKEITVDVSIDESVGEPNYDQRLVNIICENLISNAVKYTPPKGKVTVKVTGDDPISIEVSDTGYGIPAHQQDKIFTKMFRAENAVEHEPDGTGLGLYIIKSVIEEVGGTISFTSKEGKGTTFRVVLPRDGMKPRKGSRELTEGAGV